MCPTADSTPSRGSSPVPPPPPPTTPFRCCGPDCCDCACSCESDSPPGPPSMSSSTTSAASSPSSSLDSPLAKLQRLRSVLRLPARRQRQPQQQQQPPPPRHPPGRTPHSIAEPPWAPLDLESRVDATLAVGWKSRWWRLYVDTVRLGGRDSDSSMAIYRAARCWGAAAGIDWAETRALFRCYHDDDAVAALGYENYGDTMWRLCEKWEAEQQQQRQQQQQQGRGQGQGSDMGQGQGHRGYCFTGPSAASGRARVGSSKTW